MILLKKSAKGQVWHGSLQGVIEAPLISSRRLSWSFALPLPPADQDL